MYDVRSRRRVKRSVPAIMAVLATVVSLCPAALSDAGPTPLTPDHAGSSTGDAVFGLKPIGSQTIQTNPIGPLTTTGPEPVPENATIPGKPILPQTDPAHVKSPEAKASSPNQNQPALGVVTVGDVSADSNSAGSKTAALLAANTSVGPRPPAAWTAGAFRAQIRRANLPVMGDNSGVGVWLRGDASSAALRLRLYAVPDGSPFVNSASEHSGWISPAVSLNFTGWKHIVFSRSDFGFKTAPAEQYAVDRQLPPAALSVLPPESVQPNWKNINTLAVESNVPTNTSFFIDDISWVTFDELGNATSSTLVEDFETGNTAAWQPLGPKEATDPIVYAVSTVPGTAHGGRVGFKISVTSPKLHRDSVLLPSARKAMLLSHAQFLMFVPSSITDSIIPSSLPEPLTSTSSIQLSVCPDQVQAATFCVFSPKGITGLTQMPMADLQSLGHKIPGSAIDVKVVYRPKQAGYGLYIDQNAPAYGNGLLLKDDRKVAELSMNASSGDSLATDIAANTTKQFWVTVTVPRDAIPGAYAGKIVLQSNSTGPISVPIAIRVLPLRLLSPAKQYVVNLRTTIGTPPSELPSSDGRHLVTDYSSADQYEAQLSDVLSHGIKIVTLSGPDTSLADQFEKLKDDRFLAPYLYIGSADVPSVEAARKASSIPNILYLVGPMPDSAASEIQSAHQYGESVAGFVTTDSMGSKMASEFDVPIYSRDSTYSQQLVESNGARTSSKRDWWYWSAASDDALTNRLSAGYLLWKSKLYGAYVPQYQEAYGSDPYDTSSKGAQGIFANMHPQMLTYPSANGVVDTVNWELLREGIVDVRYLTTMFTALRECKDAHISVKLGQDAEAYAAALLSKPLSLMQGKDLDASRAKIADYAVKLRASVDAFNAKQANQPQ